MFRQSLWKGTKSFYIRPKHVSVLLHFFVPSVKILFSSESCCLWLHLYMLDRKVWIQPLHDHPINVVVFLDQGLCPHWLDSNVLLIQIIHIVQVLNWNKYSFRNTCSYRFYIGRWFYLYGCDIVYVNASLNVYSFEMISQKMLARTK